MITRNSQRRIHRRRSAQVITVSLNARFAVKNAVRVWAAQPDLQWPFESVDWFAGLPPHPSSAKFGRVRLDDCVAESVQAADVLPEGTGGPSVTSLDSSRQSPKPTNPTLPQPN